MYSMYFQSRSQVIIMDFSKAFDSVPHERLMLKLESYSITGSTHTWVNNFLTKREQRVVVDGEQSSFVNVRSGVLQGTVLGPLLFLLSINDLPLNITSSVRLFADDCVMYREIIHNFDAQQLQQDLNTLSTWQDNWKLRFNPDKCHVLKITRSRRPKVHQYKLGNTILSETTSHTYLGVEISNDLKWHNHIKNITAKSGRVLGFIKRNLKVCPNDLRAKAFKRNLKVCPNDLRAKAFQTLVRPHLEYCATVWDPYVNDLIMKIENIQRRGARFVFSDYRRTSSVSTMLQKLDWRPLEQRRKVTRLSMLNKIINYQVAILANEFLNPASTRRSSQLNHNKTINRLAGRSDFYNNSYFPLTIEEWNNLPEHIVNITDPKIFKVAVADHIASISTQD